MTQRTSGQTSFLRDLGDGLILRRSRPEDAEGIAKFNSTIFSGVNHPDEAYSAWALDLMGGRLPGFSPEDFTIVEDTSSGKIVSSLNLISQTWSYEGVPFEVGRIELVATLPEYRRRGLIRAQMETVHQWSAERGEPVQAITGIPWYYRQFGYEMALEHHGGRTSPADGVVSHDQSDAYRLRAATGDDCSFIADAYATGMRRYVTSCVRDETIWRYEVEGRRRESAHAEETRIIEDGAGKPAGFLVHHDRLSGDALPIHLFELAEGESWDEVTPSVLGHLKAVGTELGPADSEAEFGSLSFDLGTEHPAYDLLGDHLTGTKRPYAWYVRVPDVQGFIRRIRPVLERRLAESEMAGYSGELLVSMTDDGFKLSMEAGRITSVERWLASQEDSMLGPIERDALFAGLTFLQLLFCFRSVEELEHAFPDCLISSGEARAVLGALFPKKASRVWGIQ